MVGEMEREYDGKNIPHTGQRANAQWEEGARLIEETVHSYELGAGWRVER